MATEYRISDLIDELEEIKSTRGDLVLMNVHEESCKGTDGNIETWNHAEPMDFFKLLKMQGKYFLCVYRLN